jgi:tetratricopeptide (TPR) repeat protein
VGRGTTACGCATELDPLFAEGYWVLADVLLWMQEYDKGIATFKRALELNPNHADMLADWGGFVLPDVLGKPEEGIEILNRAKRLSPHYGDWYNRAVQNAYFMARRYDDAIATFDDVKYETFNSRLVLIASLAHAGRLDEARAGAAEVLASRPEFKVSTINAGFYTEAANEHVREGLRKAGFPE